MMQPGGGMVQAPPMIPPPMDQQHMAQQQQQQQWGMPPQQPQYHHQVQHAPQPPMWNQQPSQIPPPMPQPQALQPPPMHQAQYQAQVPMGLQQGASSSEIRSLWIGDLQYWMDESYLHNCFAQTGEVLSVKIIRNKQTGQSEGYGFIEFGTRAAAERVLQACNGTMMPNIDQVFRLNWASLGAGERRDDSADYTIFVGDLASDVTDYMLQETFRTQYPSVKGAKVVTDRTTGRSKGYGFVRFSDLSEQTRAMTEMNGMLCSSRPMRIGPAASKKNVGAQQQYSTKGCQEALFLEGLDLSSAEMHYPLVRGLS